jgi:hypothetical protein
MPSACADDNCRISHRIKLTVDLLLGGEEDLLFNFLSLPILLIEEIGERRGFGFILCEKKSQRFFRRA